MKKIEAIVRPAKLEPLKEALSQVNIKGMTVSEVHGVGNQGGWTEYYRGTEVLVNMLPKVKFEIVTTDARVDELVKVIIATARTGEVGDGKIFVSSIDEVVRIRTEENGEVAI
jgi:nitrogen regulatory protein P-II 1